MPPGRSQQIATCLNLMGDWRDSVRSQRSEKTDAVRVCRKTSGWTLCFDERGRNTWIATKCYCLLTQARQWATALSKTELPQRVEGLNRSTRTSLGVKRAFCVSPLLSRLLVWLGLPEDVWH